MDGDRFDVVIIGGGIVGLAVAMAFTERFPRLRLAVLEKEDRVAAHQSGHNSGVIHSGLYYRPGSVKAKLCVEGAAAMVEFCREHGIRCEKCGKVVVATGEEEIPALEELYRRGSANGVANLALIGPERLREIEPASRGLRALHVPGAGITDYAAVTRRYAEIVRSRGGEVRVGTRVTGFRTQGAERVLETTAGAVSARYIINCAGLYSDRLAGLAGARLESMIVPFRGEYYELAAERQHLVKGLIYPVPDPRFPFLGVHFTRRIGGGVEAGPNAVLALRREGYRKTDLHLAEALGMLAFPGFWRMVGRYWRTGLGEFYRSLNRRAFLLDLQRLVPELRLEDLRRGGAGVRAQAVDRNGRLVDDFHFVRTEGMIHVQNVPSPAATASIPIGRAIVAMATQAFDLGQS